MPLEKYPPFSWAMRPGDTPQEIYSKKLVIVYMVYSFFTFINMLTLRLFEGVYGYIIIANPLLRGLMCLHCFNGKYRPAVIEAILYLGVFAIIMQDYYSLSLFGFAKGWINVVIYIDICLVLRLPDRVAKNTILAIICWTAVRWIEHHFRFGLLDASFLPPQADRLEIVDDLYRCGTLPCSVPFSWAVTNITLSTALLLLDFYFTRGFASRLFRERDKMDKVIKTAEHIADSLSKFDLAQAESVLNTSELPEPMHDAFSRILDNLRSYRPYLPEALFLELQSTLSLKDELLEVPAPGLITKRVAMVFTDIQGSTATWEACPDGMKEGLRLHNNVMRACAVAWNGYEVKTIGDAFMVAFENTCDAVSFSLSVQEGLVQTVWPAGLLQLDHCSYNDDGPWCGLRVRIGVHCGEVDPQLNSLTGRYDYFGNTVNKAARMEGACIGGAVAVTPTVIEEVPEMLESLVVIPMGATTLKGIGGSIYPSMLLPMHLSDRRSFIESQLLLSEDERRVVLKDGVMNSVSLMAPATMRTVPSATVCKAEVQLDTEKGSEVTHILNELLAKVTLCVERTHGVVISLQGSRVALGWNASRPCSSHVESAFTFVKMLHRSYGEGDATNVHLGLSSSLAHHGTLGGGSQRFVAVVGSCLGVSDALCTMGMQRGLYCLYGSSSSSLRVPGLETGDLPVNIPSHPGTFVHSVEVPRNSSSIRWGTVMEEVPPV